MINTPPNHTPPPNVYKKILLFSYSDVVFATIWAVICFEAILGAFYTRLGFSPFLMGMVGLLPYLALFVQVFLIRWLTKVVRKRFFTILFIFLARSCWMWLPVIPFVPESITVFGVELTFFRHGLFIVLLAITYILQATHGLIWSSWISDCVPLDRRGKFFGYRSALAQAFRMVTLFLAGLFLGNEPSLTYEYPILFCVGVAAGFISVFLLSRQPKCEMVAKSLEENGIDVSLKEKILPLFIKAFRNLDYRHFIIFIACWNLINVMAAPFWIPFCIKYVHMKENQITQMLMMCTGSTILFSYIWGLVINRFGDRPVLILCCIGSIIHPWFYIIASNGVLNWTYEWMFIGEAYAGILNAGFMLSFFNYSISFGTPEEKTLYLTIYYMVSGIFGCTGALIAGTLVTIINDFTLFSIQLYGMSVILIIVSIGRILCSFLAGTFGNKGSTHKMWSFVYEKVSFIFKGRQH